MKYTLSNLFQDSELQIEFNSKIQKEKFNTFNKVLKAFRLCMNANQNLIMSSLVDKSLNSENGVFIFVKTYEAVSLGVSRSTVERFLKQLQDLQILVKVAEKKVGDERNKEIIAYAINADNLEIFLSANLKFNKYYKSIFGESLKKREKTDDSRIAALMDEIKIRDEKIKELEKMIVDLKQGEAVYDTKDVESKDVESLESQNLKLQTSNLKLQEMIEYYEQQSKDLAESMLEKARVKKETEAKANAILQEYDRQTKARMRKQECEIDGLRSENESLKTDNEKFAINLK